MNSEKKVNKSQTDQQLTNENIEQNQESENSSVLEGSMKDLLERILTFLEKFIKTKEDLQAVEEKLNDYDNLDSLMVIIKNVFDHLTIKIDSVIKNKLQDGDQKSDNTFDSKLNEGEKGKESEYEALEKIVQKHEQEIRTHIRLEQQLKLYAESLQSKLDESEKTRQELLQSTKNMINEIKRDNQVLNEQMLQVKTQNQQQQQKIQNLEKEILESQQKTKNYNNLLEKVQLLEKQQNDTIQTKPNSYRPMSEQSNQAPQQIYNHQGIQGNYKKNTNQEYELQNKRKSETPNLGQKQKSPLKERKGPTTNQDLSNNSNLINKSNNDYLKVKIEIGSNPKKQDPQFRNSYQRFYNQVKQARDDNMRGSSAHNKDRDYRTIQNSYNGSHNGSFNNVIGPYLNCLKCKKLYGDKVYATWYPVLGLFKIFIDSTKQHNHWTQNLVNIVRKNQNIKIIYGSGFSSQNRWILLDADYQKFMLQNHDFYTKSDQVLFMKNQFFNDGLFFSEKIDWKRQRQMVSEAFHFQALKGYTPLVNKITEEQIQEVEISKVNKIVTTCSEIAGKVVAATFFEDKFYKAIINGKPIIQEIQDLVQIMAEYKKNPKHLIKYYLYKDYTKYDFLMSSQEKQIKQRFLNVQQYIQLYVEKLIEISQNVKQEQVKPASFSQILIQEYFNNKISKQEIVSNFFSFFFAGIDTTGNYTAMCFYVLAKDQDLQQRIYESCMTYFKKTRGENFDPLNFEILHEDLNQITDLNNFIKENFRFNNSAAGLLFRKVIIGHDIDGIKIKKGDIINLITQTNMMSEQHFVNPDKFYIDRWERDETKHINPYGYIPFSSGQRNCLGQHLSLIEIKIMLIKYLMKFHIKKNPLKDLSVGVRIISCPTEEDLVIFENRKINK